MKISGQLDQMGKAAAGRELHQFASEPYPICRSIMDGGMCQILRMIQQRAKLGTGTLYIEPGSPWENGYCESFNGKLLDESLNGEIFCSLKEARIVIGKWRVSYNTLRPHPA